MTETAKKTVNDIVKITVNESAKKQGMRTQIPNERMAFNGQLVPGALGPGPSAQNTGKYFVGGEQGKEQ